MDKLLPASLQILVLNRGMESVVYAEAIDGALSRVVCDAEVQSLLIACQSGAMALKNFGISYYTSFSRGLDGDDRSGLERMDDVSFDFYNFAKEFKRCGIHFDYTIEVEHGHEHGKNDRHSLGLCSVSTLTLPFSEAEDRLVPTRLKFGKQVEQEYKKHLRSTWDDSIGYCLQGIERSAFFDKHEERYEVSRNETAYIRKKRGW
jgi:hypothetical protein